MSQHSSVQSACTSEVDTNEQLALVEELSLPLRAM